MGALVREDSVIALETAIRKMTSLAAQRVVGHCAARAIGRALRGAGYRR